MAAPAELPHSRYVGRQKNSVILQHGYDATQTGLRLTSSATFRESICENLTIGILQRLAPPAVTIVSVNEQPAGFNVSFPDGNVHRFLLEYPGTPHTKNTHFMTAIAQFLVLTFIEMFIDLGAEPSAAVRQQVITACSTSVASAAGIIVTPAHPGGAGAARVSVPISAEAKATLLTSICDILSRIAGSGNSITPTETGDIIITIATAPPVTVSVSAINDISDLMVYNANMAATLLLAAKQSGTPVSVTTLLNRLNTVLVGYTAVTGTIGSIIAGVIRSVSQTQVPQRHSGAPLGDVAIGLTLSGL